VLHEGSVPNNASLVLAVDTAGTRVLMLGDVERGAAAAVLATLRRDPEMAGQVDVVKVAHHGSANRLDDLYAVAAAPVGLISVGVDNDYGHPAASTLGVLTTMGYRLERTDLDGDVAVARSADGALLVARRGR
jgi:competence protein ComEC